jgi:acyl carrier protein
MNEVAERVREFIVRAARLRSLDDDENILETGLVNSLLLVQILTFVEEELGVEVSDEDLVVSNFQSVTAITTLVERIRNEPPATESLSATS